MIQRILFTNDDGIESKSILTLEKRLSESFETYIVAPDSQKSATSMAFKFYSSFNVKKVDDNKYAGDCYPADCVNFGLYSKLIPEIDLVLSGINFGLNVGCDIYYSGTIGAARHAVLQKKYAFAISSEKEENDNFEKEADFIYRYLQENKNKLDINCIYNFNFPREFSLNLDEIEITSPEKILYIDNFSIENTGENLIKFFPSRIKSTENKHIKGGDYSTVQNGKVSLSLLYLEDFKV